MGQQSDSLKDCLLITLNRHNLVFSRTIQRVYQEKQRIMSIYQEELQRSLGVHTPGLSVTRPRPAQQNDRSKPQRGTQQGHVVELRIPMVEPEMQEQAVEPEAEVVWESEVQVEEPEVQVVVEPRILIRRTQQGDGSLPGPLAAPCNMATPATDPVASVLVDRTASLQWMDELELELAKLRSLLFDVDKEVTYQMATRSCDLRHHWKEWVYGVADNPSIWRLNGIHGRSVFALNGKSAETRWRWHESFPLKSNSYDQLWKYKRMLFIWC
ncbi:hypothetical protein MVEG_03691 [Podila verticillata NRRL 6337]|nr:hypothetical protein MVEG_03691 [Podila verticillata NRRL 6337]